MLSTLTSQRVNFPQTFRYSEPSVRSISPEDGPASGAQVTIVGQDFGPRPAQTDCSATTRVFIGGSCCVWSAWTHTSIVCNTTTGNARSEVVVVVAGQGLNGTAAPVYFTYREPLVTDMSPRSGNTTGGDVLTLSGQYFGTGVFRVSFVPNVTDVPVLECTVTSSYTQGGVDFVTCLTPSGAGSGHAVRVQNVGFLTLSNVTFSYNPPVITSVVAMSEAYARSYPPAYKNRSPLYVSHRPALTTSSLVNKAFVDRAGNAYNPLLLLVSGYNLASTSVVSIGAVGCATAPASFLNATASLEPGGISSFEPQHYTVVCLAPSESLDGNTAVVVTASGQSSAPYTRFKYDPPVVVAISPSVMDAALNGSKFLQIFGFNFGTSTSVNLTAGICKDVNCTTQLVCAVQVNTTMAPVLLAFNPSPTAEESRQVMTCSFNGSMDMEVGPHKVDVSRLGQRSISRSAYTVNMSAQCEPEFFGTVGERCQLCSSIPDLKGAICPGGGEEPYPDVGFSRVSRLVMVECNPRDACLGGKSEINCAKGYASLHCRGAWHFWGVHLWPGRGKGRMTFLVILRCCLSAPFPYPSCGEQSVCLGTIGWRVDARNAPTWRGSPSWACSSSSSLSACLRIGPTRRRSTWLV